VRVECIIPILRVKDLAASIRFYTDILGFKLDWGHPDPGPFTFASVSRDGHAIMLCEGSQGQPGTWLWIGVEDIEPLFAECTAKGVKVVLPPTNFEWAYEMNIKDPDGHVLRFGCEPRTDRPIV
jgi:catechol 2,3-dioxygenase-like lactoylglutathione lyase family enzyme